jgi:hypothetical protein
MKTKITAIAALIILSIIVWLTLENSPSKITELHPNGVVKLTKEYRDDEPYGTWNSYNTEGSKLLEVEFMSGSLIRSLKTYHSNGRVKNSMVALTSWTEEFTKGRDSVRFVIETYDNKGNRVKNKIDTGSVDDSHKGVTYLFPWYDGEDVTGFIKTSQTKNNN